MKKILFLIFFITILAGCGLQNNITGKTKESFSTSSVSYSTGSNETVESNQHDFLGHIYSFHMFNSNQGWFKAQNNDKWVLLRTVNAGKEITVNQKNIGASSKVFFYDLNHGWLFESTGKEIKVMNTIDAGQHWKLQANINHSDEVVGIYFVTEKEGWIVTNSMQGALGHTQRKLYTTKDGGQTWKIISSDSGYIQYPKPTKDPLPQMGSISGITFQTSNIGWIGLGGLAQNVVTLYHTDDEGHSWKPVILGLPKELYSKDYFPDAGTPGFLKSDQKMGFFISTLFNGNPQNTRYVLYHTIDGGSSWESLLLPEGLSNPEFLNKDVGFALKNGTILVETENGGSTWHEIQSDQIYLQTIKQFPELLNIQCLSENEIWLLFYDKRTKNTRLLKTNNLISWVVVN